MCETGYRLTCIDRGEVYAFHLMTPENLQGMQTSKCRFWTMVTLVALSIILAAAAITLHLLEINDTATITCGAIGGFLFLIPALDFIHKLCEFSSLSRGR